MNKIEMLEEAEAGLKKKLDIVTGSQLPWREYLKHYGYEKDEKQTLTEMCEACIKKQVDEHGRQRITCTGLANFKNTLTAKYGEEVYNQITKDKSAEDLESLENLYNPIKWLDDVLIDDNPLKKMFDPRWYQVKILNCTATRKVLRMGRRCIEQNQKLKGKKKNYSIKHLFHLCKYHKKLPYIQTLNPDTFELEWTNRYYILPNPEHRLIHFLFEDGTDTKITAEHPLLTVKDKQIQFVESRSLQIGDKVVKNNNDYKTIKDIKYLKYQKSYHLTVLDTNTFVDSTGLVHHNTGKALDINTPIPTPNGWKKMKDIQVGDKVYNDLGKPCTVTFTSPIQEDRECFKLTFNDGTDIVADAEHQWNIFTDSKAEFTITTKEMIQLKEELYIRIAKPLEGKFLAPLFAELIIDRNSKTYYLEHTIRNIRRLSELGLKFIIKGDKILLQSLRYEEGSFRSITKIEPVKSRPVKCISVDTENSLYLAGNNLVVTHNTASMTVGLLHRLLSTSEYRVLMVAPMQTMIDEVYDTIKKYCSKMGVDPIQSASTIPIHEIVFTNKSVFKGVTAGAQGAKGTRGKGADLVYVDECLTAYARITMSDGRTKAIVDVDEGEYVLSYDLSTGKFVPQRVLAVRSTGVKEVYRYKTISGKVINATPNHPVLTTEGWKPIQEAKDIAVQSRKGSGVFFETIVSRVKKSTEKTYNLEVEKTHIYIADGFIVHNCDFLSSKDMNSITAILADTAETEFWASSTPIGENNLYRLSKNAKFKEFHYPTYVSPTYNDDMDEDFKSQMDQTGIIQEILADFGADDNMVFQIQFIENCTLDKEQSIDIEQIRHKRQDYFITMGVDWNHDKVGTRIILVARHKAGSKYLIISKNRVAIQNWTQPEAVKLVKQLNREWAVDYIYVDEGFGITQLGYIKSAGMEAMSYTDPEDLKYQHLDIRLLDTEGVQFGSNLTITDVDSNLAMRKQTKQFLVETLVNVVAEGKIVLQEDEDRDIITQMKNYYVKSRSASGLKVYSARDKIKIGDHDLDALMLAIFAFQQKIEENGGVMYQLYDPIISSKADVGYSPQPRDEENIRTQVTVAGSRSSFYKRRQQFKPRKTWK